MGLMLEVTSDTFQKTVLEADKPVLVEFSAHWCAPCKRLEPIVEQLSQEWVGRMATAKINVDESASIAMQFQVMSLPTLILFDKGKEVTRVMGLQSRDKLVERFSPYL